MLHFQFAEYFYVLLGAPILVIAFISVLRWKKRAASKIGDPDLVKSLIADYSPKKFKARFFLTLGAFFLCVLAVAGLVLPDKSQRITRRGTDLIIALDVSKSMLATDIKPNRLERSKQLISKIIDQLPDERIGLVIFAGRAYLQMPLTIDHKAARMYVASVSTNDVPTQGTVISNALRMSLAAFNPEDKSYKSVLLISDGEDHDRDAESAAKELARQGIMVNTIGIGSPAGAPIPDENTGHFKVDKNGNMVISKLNEKELQTISSLTHGVYQLYSDPDNLVSNIKNQLAQMESGAVLADSSYLNLKQYYGYFLGGAFLLLLIEMFTSDKRRAKARLAAIMTVLICASSATVQAQSANQAIREGNSFFQKSDFDQAEKKYREAAEQTPDNDVAHFNLGNVQYRKNELDAAVKSFDQTIQHARSNALKQNAYYNKGVAYQKADKLPECILAYKNALLLDPADEAARQNLQKALKQQQEQEKQNQQDQNKQNQQNQKNDQKEKDQRQQQPQPNPSSISRKDAEEKLKALSDKERDLQDKLRKMRGASSDSREKDW